MVKNIGLCIVLLVTVIFAALQLDASERKKGFMQNSLSYKYVNSTPLMELLADKDILEQLALSGERKYAKSCASCHSMNGKGGYGVPDLTDDDWLWGGKIEDIYYSIKYGIRSDNEKTRMSQMPPFGQYGFISEEDVEDVARYELFLSQGGEYPERGKKIFNDYCVECHLERGRGDPEYGAPNLLDDVYLYGDDLESVIATITYGRQAIMPHFVGTLDEYSIKILSIYVHSLGGGQSVVADSDLLGESSLDDDEVEDGDDDDKGLFGLF